jgi:hypothetical protein
MVPKKENKTLELNLIDNGVNFILKGIDELFDEDHVLREYSKATDISADGYKYGVLHLFSGFLLLLKERLSRHLPELIFKGKIKDVRQNISKQKTMSTVDLDEALERLEIGPKVTFTSSEIKIIRRIQEVRNQFEHYKVSVDRFALWSNLSDFLELIDTFLFKELQINIEDSPDNIELQRKIRSINFIQKRIEQQRKQEWYEEAKKRQKKFNRKRKKAIQEIEGAYYTGDADGEPYILCPDCYENTLITYGEFRGICSNSECNSINSITGCSRCDSPVPGFLEEFGLCEGCQSWLESQ